MNSNLLTLALWLTGSVAVALCVGRTFWVFLAASLTNTGRALGPRRTGAADPRIEPMGQGESAHTAYWSRQMWLDVLSSVGAAAGALWHLLINDWLGRVAKRLFQARQPATGQKGKNWFTCMVMAAVAPGTAAGAVAGALLAAVLTATILTVFALLLGLVWLFPMAAVGVLRTAERLRTLTFGIRMKCPYPGCYRPFPLGVHRCPGCGTTHAALRPNRYGALWHRCSCGTKLVTTTLAGRGRLAAQCPHCAQQLPELVGSVRVVHLPLIGGTSSGKTMLMAAMVAGLRSWSQYGTASARLHVEFASKDDKKDFGALNQQLTQTGWTLKTQGGQPRAFMLCVRYGRRRRLLYLYDPMGESLRDAGSIREQQYLTHADGVILVADVLADPQVRRALEGADAERADAARPSDLGPLDTYQRLTGELAALTGRRRRLPLATVISKRDVLDRITSLPVPGARLDAWLESIGLGALVRSLNHDFSATRYWAVSAHAATGAGALDSEQRRAAEPVLWVLAASGLRVGALSESVATSVNKTQTKGG